jgi:hypothetical protein
MSLDKLDNKGKLRLTFKSANDLQLETFEQEFAEYADLNPALTTAKMTKETFSVEFDCILQSKNLAKFRDVSPEDLASELIEELKDIMHWFPDVKIISSNTPQF